MKHYIDVSTYVTLSGRVCWADSLVSRGRGAAAVAPI